MDYKANSNKAKDPNLPEKKIEKVITGEVVIKKKTLAQKAKDLFIEADFKSVARYVVHDVLIPAARTMIVDGATKGVERMIYGVDSRGYRRPPGQAMMRSSYGGSPMQMTPYRHPATRPPVPSSAPTYPRAGRDDFFIESKEEAETVLQSLHDIVEMYESVSVADYHELLGIPSNHVDHKWGWVSLVGSHVQPTRAGFIINLPDVVPV